MAEGKNHKIQIFTGVSPKQRINLIWNLPYKVRGQYEIEHFNDWL